MSIKKVAVIGSGVMGSGIAAQLTNAGIPVVLLDIKVEGKDLAKEAVAKMLKADPAPFMRKRNAKMITTGTILLYRLHTWAAGELLGPATGSRSGKASTGSLSGAGARPSLAVVAFNITNVAASSELVAFMMIEHVQKIASAGSTHLACATHRLRVRMSISLVCHR